MHPTSLNEIIAQSLVRSLPDIAIMQGNTSQPCEAGSGMIFDIRGTDRGRISVDVVLPQRVVDALHLQSAGDVGVRYADNRRETRPRVTNVWLSLCGRDGVFSATVEPNHEDALIGAIVLEELDLIVDCPTESIHPRDPDMIITEIE